jgi:transposase
VLCGEGALPIRYGCLDESRFGLKSIPRRRITLSGTKPQGPVQWRFEAFSLYGAVEPMTGESFFLEFTHSDSTCFEVYLEQLAQHYPHRLHVIQLDQGSLHTAKRLQLPDHVVLLFQPPHSPQLNPIERLWQHLKDPLSWQIFDRLDDLREVLTEHLKALTPAVIASLTGYDFILSALKNANI